MNNLKIIPFLSRLSKKERFLLAVTVLIVLFAGLDRLILSPLLSNIKLLDAKILEQKEVIKKSLIIVRQKAKLMDDIDRYNSYLGEAESEEIEIASFLKLVESVAEQSSVYIVDIKPLAIKELGMAKQYLLELNLEAQMEQIITFFYAIESIEELLSIETYSIRPKEGTSSIAVCNVNISKMVIPR